MPDLRVCFDCQYIFDLETKEACPACKSTKHDGAREVLGPKAYTLRKSQKPWFDRQMLAHAHHLRTMIEEMEG